MRTVLLPLAGAGLITLTACGGERATGPTDPRANAPPSAAYLVWKPGPGDTCPIAVHNSYSVVGPDGKLYPTWHPPVDPATGCSFGHEHGRDPHGSNLSAGVGDIPFGFANEQLDGFDPNGMRHEDHVGHKVEWENGVQMHLTGAPDALLNVTCDVMTKLHQGTHSKDAFTNNLHELAYHIKCTDGTELHTTTMSAIGRPGEFVRSCDDAVVVVGPATPANSPVGGGKRRIPARSCATQFVLVLAPGASNFSAGLHESWQTSNAIRKADGKTLASFNPYFQVNFPSRFYDPGLATLTGRSIGLCYETGPNGERARGGACLTSTNNGVIPGLTYDDARSPFNGVSRFVDINSNAILNAGGAQVWYTDPFGKNGQAAPFPGSIKQFVAAITNTATPISGPRIGGARYYGGTGVHAPN